MTPEEEKFGVIVRLESSDRHAIERAEERYGLEINAFLLRQLERLVRLKQAGIALEGPRHLECEVMLCDRRVRFVYLKKTGRIVTFLPLQGRGQQTPIVPKQPYRVLHKHLHKRRKKTGKNPHQ